MNKGEGKGKKDDFELNPIKEFKKKGLQQPTCTRD